jgi:hypothetical protein
MSLNKKDAAPLGRQIMNKVCGKVYIQVGNEVWSLIDWQVVDKVRDQVRDQVGFQVWRQVVGEIRSRVWNQVWDQALD